ncbi:MULTISPECIES: PEP-CTERM sorting domain-containing protein [Microcoleaceae]|uniref:PEP-CTERM sorting domain-containing protein n=1 Tax=Microcoleaceae TaxID=1892252 RepID=UPI00187E6BD3|nr:PEP-CTERM sorting domain-containing protein [Tychonema sp. LEGE 06208]MBE9161860.1 PEP-CTERM sorting domain-containing protein [Tychonema sp. LEGE 06208]
MCTPLAKLAIGLSATMATGFFYLAAAPPGVAQVDVCGPGNFSSACSPDNSPSPTPPSSPSIESLRSGTQASDAVEKSPDPPPAQSLNFTKIYTNNATPQRAATSIPEPGTVVALLVTGAGIIGSGRKRNKQVGQSR